MRSQAVCAKCLSLQLSTALLFAHSNAHRCKIVEYYKCSDSDSDYFTSVVITMCKEQRC